MSPRGSPVWPFFLAQRLVFSMALSDSSLPFFSSAIWSFIPSRYLIIYDL